MSQSKPITEILTPEQYLEIAREQRAFQLFRLRKAIEAAASERREMRDEAAKRKRRAK